jgi:hypothetical protein
MSSLDGRTVTFRDPTAPRPIIYGQARVGGSIRRRARCPSRDLDVLHTPRRTIRTVVEPTLNDSHTNAVYFSPRQTLRAGFLYGSPS